VITHPDKVLFLGDGITKGDLAVYYEAIAPVMLPHLGGRPLTMERYPAGIGNKGFWQKKEVERGDVEPQTFTIRSMAARIHQVGDVWNDIWRRRRSLKRAIEKLKRLNQR
jgi:DNA primase